MVQEREINITKSEYRTFTTFKFYSRFLPELRNFYVNNPKSEPPAFSLLESCYIDSSCLPLIISLGNTLKQFHHKPIPLLINNIPGTLSNKVLNYLDKSDFFYLVGENSNPSFPIGRKIFDFENRMLGWNTSNLTVRNEHKVKGYSLNDIKIDRFKNLPEDYQRDKLIEHYSFEVDSDFNEIFEDNEITSSNRYFFIDILSELITNSLIHSDSDCFLSFHTTKFKTAISISDTGIGFYDSLHRKKTQQEFYQFSELTNAIINLSSLKLEERVKNNFFSIFEALYYSCLKDRRGLFDLMCSIVLNGHGIFRIHNYSVQLIVSSKLDNELKQLFELREKIFKNLINLKANEINKQTNQSEIKRLSDSAKQIFLNLFLKVINNYSKDIQYSSVRFFNVEFKGVHIEAEIPRTYTNEI